MRALFLYAYAQQMEINKCFALISGHTVCVYIYHSHVKAIKIFTRQFPSHIRYSTHVIKTIIHNLHI